MVPPLTKSDHRSSFEDEEEHSNESSREKSEDAQEGETVIDLVPTPVPVHTRIPVPVQPPPWFEWSDDVINEESWDVDTPEYDYFEDTFSIAELLRSKAYRWMRPSEILPVQPAVIKFKTQVLDLVSPNAHLFEKSEALRYILSEISELYEYSLQNKFVCEGEGVAYVPNYADDDKSWAPWNHIYSCCKAGVKGEVPVFNPKGKHYVRLYFMGAWRRIMVDDRIPVLHSGLTALPLTSLNELWPLILTKALLKVAMATWDTNNVKRFSTTSALTGWVFEWIDNIDGLPEEDLWNDLEGLLPKFKHPSRIPSAYNLAAPQISREKKSTKEGGAGETFWWMPAVVAPPADLNEVIFKDFEKEPLTQTGAIVTSAIPTKDQASSLPTSFLWQNKGDQLLKLLFTKEELQNDANAKGGSLSKRKKAELDALNNDVKSGDKKKDKEKKGDAKSRKVEKEKERAKKKARFPKDGEEKTDHAKDEDDEEEDDDEEEEKEKEKEKDKPSFFKPTMKHWSKLKNILLGDEETPEVTRRKSRSVPKGLKKKNESVMIKPMDDSDTQPQSGNSASHATWVKKDLNLNFTLKDEEDHSKDVVHALKAKTPFVFKRDWYEFWEKGFLNFDEYPGEDDDDPFDSGAFFSLKNAVDFANPAFPPHPLTSYVDITRARGGADTIPTGRGGSIERAEGNQNPKRESDSNTLIVIMHPKGSQSYQSAAAASTKRKPGRMTTHTQGKGAQQPSPNTDNLSISGQHEEKAEVGKVSTPPILENDIATVRGESEDETEEGSHKASQNEDIVPSSSCGTMWFTCADVAQNLRKICKFYPSKSTFGSCYILRREVDHTKLNLDPTFQELHSDLPKYPNMVTEYNQKQENINFNIEFDRWKSYHVTNYHLNGTHKHDIDTAFYLFSDNWTEQELIISVFVLQEELIKRFTVATTTHVEGVPAPPPTPNVLSTAASSDDQTKTVNAEQPQLQDTKLIMDLNFILEPWDWRKDCCLAQPLIYTSIQDHWIVHVRLPAGRNIFRLWLVPQSEQDPTNSDPKRKFSVPFSVRVVSQTPIYIGSRMEVQNYMTNPPILFLKQCANNIWGLFACFGKKRNEYHKNLKQLRRTYCSAYPEPDTINKYTKGTHDTFEQLFVSLITFLNGGTLDRLMILAMRVLLLNPMESVEVLLYYVFYLNQIGRQFVPKIEENSLEAKVFEGVLKTLGKRARTMVYSAVIIIQKFYRGWRVRRLFRLRDKTDPRFKKIEYCVRRIGFLLARETDSIYSHEEPIDPNEKNPKHETPITSKPPNIFPTPPHWAVDTLRYLIDQNPWLLTIHPHAYCVPHHIQLSEMEGEVPPDIKNFSWFPFLRETLKIPPTTKSCFCEIDLQTYPYTGVCMKIINNDNGKLSLKNTTLFLGHIPSNKRGYTVFCYRWTVPRSSLVQDLNDRSPSKLWKLRIVSPYNEPAPRFVSDADDEETNVKASLGVAVQPIEPIRQSIQPQPPAIRNSNESQHTNNSEKNENPEENDNVDNENNGDNMENENIENEFPHKLCLRRLEGYYMPSKDASICRYILETEEKKCRISLRFRASHAKARVRIQVWDCSRKSLIFEETCDGGLLVPCIQLHVTKKSVCSLNLAYDSSESLKEDWSRGDLISCSGLLSLEKTSSGEIEVENEDEEEEKEKVESTKMKDENNVDNIPDPIPEGSPGIMKRRYVISVYVVDDSWQLTDNEWLFVLDKKRDFFRDLTKWYSRNCEVKRRATEKHGGDELNNEEDASLAGHHLDQDLEGTNTELIAPPSQPSESTDKPKEKEKPDFVSTKRKKTRADKSLKERVEKDKTEQEKKTEKIEKNEKADQESKDGGAVSDLTHYTHDQLPSAPPPTAYPITNTTSSATAINSPMEQSDEKIRRRGSGSLLIKYGGRQSQDIKQLDKPYWILEVLLDANVKYKMKSNRHQFRKKFLRAQESWNKECTANQEGADKPVDENNVDMANIYECLCPEDEDDNGFTNQGVMNPACCYNKDAQTKKAHGSNSDEENEEEQVVQDVPPPPAPAEHGEAVMALEQRRVTETDKLVKDHKKQRLLAAKSKIGDKTGSKNKMTQLVVEKLGVGAKGKKLKVVPSATIKPAEEDNIEKQPSAQITSHPDELPPPLEETTVEIVENETQPEPENPLTEKETVRMKRCGVVGDILKCYAELFMQTIPVREELLEMVKKNQLETKGPKKLVLTKTGVGKYCEKLFHMDKTKKTKEAVVAEKLMRWAFEYFCLEPAAETGETNVNEEDNGDKVTLFLH